MILDRVCVQKSLKKGLYIKTVVECPDNVMVKEMDCGIVENSSRSFTFTFGQIPRGKVWTPYSPSYRLSSSIAVLLEGWV